MYTPVNSLSSGKWHNIVYTYNGSGLSTAANYQIYIDGVAQTITKNPGGIGGSASTDYIGKDQVSNFFNGSIADVQLYNTTLTQNAVNAIYKQGLGGSPPSFNGLTGWWPLNGNAYDYSGNSNNGIATNVIYYNYPYIYNPTAASLNLQNAYMPGSVSFNGISGGGVASNGGYIKANNPVGANPWYMYLIQSGGSDYLGGYVSGWITSTPAIKLNTWSFDCFSYSSGHSTLTVYINGVAVGAGANSGGANIAACAWVYPRSLGNFDIASIADTTSYMNIGSRNNGAQDTMNGSIADLRIYTTPLTAAQVAQLYLNDTVLELAPTAYWPLSEPYAGQLNVTQDVVKGNNGYFYLNSANLCSIANVLTGACGATWAPG